MNNQNLIHQLDSQKNLLYSEAQPCKQPLIWMLVLGIAGYIWYSVYHQIILGIPFGSKPAPDIILIIIWVIFGVLFPYGLFKARLIIKLNNENFYYRYFPLHLNEHSFPIRGIKNIEPVLIRPLFHFGGWGIRYGFKGKGYIMSGGKGIKVSFNSGRPVYFSAKNADDIVDAFRKAITR